jgi:hypothetical protein
MDFTSYDRLAIDLRRMDRADLYGSNTILDADAVRDVYLQATQSSITDTNSLTATQKSERLTILSCTTMAQSDLANWITAASPSFNSGSARASYRVAPNSESARDSSLLIANGPVHQAGTGSRCGTVRVVVDGLNQNPMGDGRVATVTFGFESGGLPTKSRSSAAATNVQSANAPVRLMLVPGAVETNAVNTLVAIQMLDLGVQTGDLRFLAALCAAYPESKQCQMANWLIEDRSRPGYVKGVSSLFRRSDGNGEETFVQVKISTVLTLCATFTAALLAAFVAYHHLFLKTFLDKVQNQRSNNPK